VARCSRLNIQNLESGLPVKNRWHLFCASDQLWGGPFATGETLGGEREAIPTRVTVSRSYRDITLASMAARANHHLMVASMGLPLAIFPMNFFDIRF
jgi:hypothetical protein